MIKREKEINDSALLHKREGEVTEPSCANCPGLCCHDLVMILEKPKTKDDLDTFRWYLQYENSFLYILDGTWHHLIKTVCSYLDPVTKLCNNYENRQKKCIDHVPPACERFGQWFDVWFSTPEELVLYAETHALIKKPAKKKAAKKSVQKSSSKKAAGKKKALSKKGAKKKTAVKKKTAKR